MRHIWQCVIITEKKCDFKEVSMQFMPIWITLTSRINRFYVLHCFVVFNQTDTVFLNTIIYIENVYNINTLPHPNNTPRPDSLILRNTLLYWIVLWWVFKNVCQNNNQISASRMNIIYLHMSALCTKKCKWAIEISSTVVVREGAQHFHFVSSISPQW